MNEGPAEDTPPAPEKVTALVVSPVAPEAKAVTGYLKRRGYRVVVEPAGCEAETLARMAALQVAVTDLRLSDPSGLEVTAALRAHNLRLPLVTLHAGASPQSMARLKELGAEALASPFRMEDLGNCLAVAVSRAAESRPVGAAERRRHMRATVALPARVCAVSGESADGMVADVSLGGMRVHAPTPLSGAREVIVSLRLPSDRQPLALRAEVLRTYPNGDLALLLLRPPFSERARYFSYVGRCVYNNRYRVLVADDAAAIRQLATETLGELGFDCREADRIETIKARLQAERVDVMLANINFPDGNGLDLVRALRGDYPHLAIGFSSGTIQGADESAIQAMGLSLLRKPWTPVQLLERVAELVRPPEAAKQPANNA